jgi:hypothetical protein
MDDAGVDGTVPLKIISNTIWGPEFDSAGSGYDTRISAVQERGWRRGDFPHWNAAIMAFFVTLCHRTGTFTDGDVLDEYYTSKFRTRGKTRSDLLFLFQQYHHNKQQ